MTYLIEPPAHHWYCPNCDLTDVTHEVRPHSRMHPCRGTYGLSIAFIPVGTKAKIEVTETGDYVNNSNNSIPRLDDTGRPVAAAITTRDDGQDAVVYAPTIALRAGV